MCDYSLQGLPNRLAVEGEQVVSFRFPVGSVGLAAPRDIVAVSRPKLEAGCRRSWWSVLKYHFHPQMELDQVPAVCIPPGAQLLMHRIPESLRQRFGLEVVEDVTFVQCNADAYRYRDGIRFRSGKHVLLQEIPENVCFEVLSLSSGEGEPEPAPRGETNLAFGSLVGKQGNAAWF